MAIETQELAAIKSGISVAMSSSAGQFRQAATAGAVSMTKIVKDISNIFAAQRRDLADLSNNINEVVNELEQTNSKFDNLERVFEESLSIQTAMRGDLKTMAIAMKNMTDGIYQLDRNMQSVISTGPNSLLSGLTAGLTSGFGGVTGKLGELLLKVGGGAVLGGAAVAGANYLAGGGGGGEQANYSGSVGGKFWTPEKQKYAANYLVEKGGFTPYGAAGAVARMTKEAPAGPTSVNPNGGAFGIAQWLGARKIGIQGNTDFDAQLQHYVMEVTPGTPEYQRAGSGKAAQLFRSAKTPEEGAQAAMHFERAEGYKESGGRTDILVNRTPVETIYKNAFGQQPNAQKAEKQDTTPAAQTPAAMPTAPAGSASTPADTHNHKEETLGKDADKVKGQGAVSSLPSGDIVALGKALQQRGIRVSEHPSFGGVSHVHGTNSAHYQGQAIDINATSGNSKEADDPVMGPKFDKLAQELQAAGYTVLWKVKDHFNHIHAQIGGQGIRGGKSAIGGASTSDYMDTSKAAVTPGATPAAPSAPAVSPSTPLMVTPPTTPSSVLATPAIEQATPVSQEAVSPAVSAPISSADTSAMMGMMPGGLGGILGMIESLLGSLAPTEAYAQETTQSQNAEMLQSLSKSAVASETIKQAAIQSQAPQLEETAVPSQSITTMPSTPSSVGGYNFQQPGYAYNFDVGWADWASRLGGNHWKEMHKYKESLIS